MVRNRHVQRKGLKRLMAKSGLNRWKEGRRKPGKGWQSRMSTAEVV